MNIAKSGFGLLGDQEVYLFRLNNSNGITLSVTDYGATITSLFVPDKDGNKTNIVLGYDTLSEYVTDPFYMGCVVGRFAGRIAKGAFSMDGVQYKLECNGANTGNHIHGGIAGFNKKVFNTESLKHSETSVSVELRYLSPDMQEGYPGNLNLRIRYELTDDNEFVISYFAETDKATHVNLTNHSYFNLSGPNSALDHELIIYADSYLETNSQYIPTGNIKNVENSPYDFRKSRKIKEYITELEAPGYNECYVLNNEVAAELYDQNSGRKVVVRTSMPGLLLYTGDYLEGRFKKNQGVCLETQFFPDTPNHPGFPSTLLLPGQLYQHQTSFKIIW